MAESEDAPESRYETLEKPEFKPSVPSYIREGLTKKDQHVTDTLSVIEQQNTWLITNVIAASKIHRNFDRRVAHIETWRLSLTTKIVGALVTAVLAPLIVSVISHYLLTHWKP